MEIVLLRCNRHIGHPLVCHKRIVLCDLHSRILINQPIVWRIQKESVSNTITTYCFLFGCFGWPILFVNCHFPLFRFAHNHLPKLKRFRKCVLRAQAKMRWIETEPWQNLPFPLSKKGIGSHCTLCLRPSSDCEGSKWHSFWRRGLGGGGEENGVSLCIRVRAYRCLLLRIGSESARELVWSWLPQCHSSVFSFVVPPRIKLIQK